MQTPCRNFDLPFLFHTLITELGMIFNPSEKEERDYLEHVIERLKKAIRRTDVSVTEHVDTLAEYKDYLWSNKDIDPHEIRSMRESILNHFAIGESVIDLRRRLGKILDTPYFGRIDFREKAAAGNVLPLYIGTHTFYDKTTKTQVIHDWRAPISGMFYDAELGDACYASPQGKVSGHISLKRQYRIRNGKMEFMIENSLAIHDDILEKELSAPANDRMKNIVATIQREQNRIIRNEEAHTLIIQGVAGSGKTSIALHRIAYLLYRFKEGLSSQDILILSPNRVFSDYISNVLPELGEEMVPQTSMEQILSGILGNKYRYQDFAEQVTDLLARPNPGLMERIRYKASLEFAAALDRFILHIENTCFRAVDVPLTPHFTVPSEYITEQFRRFNRLPMRRRFEAMTDYILETARIQYHITTTTAGRNGLAAAIRKMFAANNDIRVYKDFFAWIGKPELFHLRKGRTLEYADLAPLAYLHLALEGNTAQTRVKHLVIDEMQDYSPIQYRVVQKLFPGRKTLLGDAGQAVNPYGSSTAETIRKAFVTGEVVRLNKSYRSTYEITAFAQLIQPNDELEPVSRHGEAPQVLACRDQAEQIGFLTDLISIFKESAYISLGIICKTESQAADLADELTAWTDGIQFLSSRHTDFVPGIVVTSAHMAKGLEFDAVIVPDADDLNYREEIDRRLLYIASTRAMHRLSLTYTGKISRLLFPYFSTRTFSGRR